MVFKRFLLTALLTVLIVINLMNLSDVEQAYARSSYYLPTHFSTSTKVDTLSGPADEDTTAAFSLARYMTFIVHCQQANDSTSHVAVLDIAQKNVGDSTHTWIEYDSAVCHLTGVNALKWKKHIANSDSTIFQAPPATYGRIRMQGVTGKTGKHATYNIYNETRKEGEY